MIKLLVISTLSLGAVASIGTVGTNYYLEDKKFKAEKIKQLKTNENKLKKLQEEEGLLLSQEIDIKKLINSQTTEVDNYLKENSKSKDLNNDLLTIKNSLKTLEDNLKTIEESLKNKNSEISVLKEEIATKKSNFEKLQNLETLGSLLNAEEAKKTTIEGNKKEANQKIADFNRQISDKTTLISAATTEKNEKTKNFDDELKKLNEKKRDQTTKIEIFNEKQSTYNSADKALTDLNQLISQKEEAWKNLKNQQTSKKESELKGCLASKIIEEFRCDQIPSTVSVPKQAKIDKSEKEFNQEKAKLSTTTQAKTTAKSELDTATSDKDVVDKAVETINNKLNQTSGTIFLAKKQAEDKYQKLIDEKTELENQLKTEKNNLAQLLTDSIEQTISGLNSKKNDYQTKQSEIKVKEDLLVTKNQEKTQIENNRTEKSNEIEKIKNEITGHEKIIEKQKILSNTNKKYKLIQNQIETLRQEINDLNLKIKNDNEQEYKLKMPF